MKFLYVTESGRLAGMQDVSAMTARQKYRLVNALPLIGREGFVSDSGICICSVCHEVLGFRDVPAGQISHGYCAACYAAESAKIKNIYVDPELPGVEV
jgi:hypothetical protein